MAKTLVYRCAAEDAILVGETSYIAHLASHRGCRIRPLSAEELEDFRVRPGS